MFWYIIPSDSSGTFLNVTTFVHMEFRGVFFFSRSMADLRLPEESDN